MFTLPKRFEIKDRSAPWVHDEKWISNGHFAVAKAMVKDSYKYCAPGPGEREVERCKPQNPSKTFHKTDMLFDHGAYYARVFKSFDGEEVFLRECYVQHFELDTLKGTDKDSPFINENESVFLMPCRR